MNLEQLAILGIIVFAFMAMSTSFNAIRSIKRVNSNRRNLRRVRRLVGSAASARSIADSVIKEVAVKNSLEVQRARDQGRLTPELEEALALAQTYFLGRVESRHRVLFSKAVDEIILAAKPVFSDETDIR